MQIAAKAAPDGYTLLMASSTQFAKAKPGQVMNYGSTGCGAAPHIAAELLKRLAAMAFTWLECVGRDFSTPYRGIAIVAADNQPALDAAVAVYRPVTIRFGPVQ